MQEQQKGQCGKNRVNGVQSGVREDWKVRQEPDQWLLTLGMCELGRKKYKCFHFF